MKIMHEVLAGIYCTIKHNNSCSRYSIIDYKPKMYVIPDLSKSVISVEEIVYCGENGGKEMNTGKGNKATSS